MRIVENIAREKGYKDKYEMLRDYGLTPTVRVPKHKKAEFVLLLWRHFKGKS